MTGTEKISALASKVEARLTDKLLRVHSLPDELCYEVQPSDIKECCLALRDDPSLRFEILIDLAGIDYLDYGTSEWKTLSATDTGFSRGVNRDALRIPHEGARFAVAYQLLSITHNQRLRIRARCEDAEDPIIDSVVDVWPGANWFEREAFDMFGNIEVRYDADKQRVVYEPVSIEPRTLVPKVIRTDNRYDAALKK